MHFTVSEVLLQLQGSGPSLTITKINITTSCGDAYHDLFNAITIESICICLKDARRKIWKMPRHSSSTRRGTFSCGVGRLCSLVWRMSRLNGQTCISQHHSCGSCTPERHCDIREKRLWWGAFKWFQCWVTQSWRLLAIFPRDLQPRGFDTRHCAGCAAAYISADHTTALLHWLWCHYIVCLKASDVSTMWTIPEDTHLSV